MRTLEIKMEMGRSRDSDSTYIDVELLDDGVVVLEGEAFEIFSQRSVHLSSEFSDSVSELGFCPYELVEQLESRSTTIKQVEEV